MMKKLPFLFLLFILVIFFGKSLFPGDKMFDFHDVSQPARVAEFTYDLMHSQIPPRVAPHLSFGLGYPVLNFYAPFSYWVTSIIHMSGFDIADSIKLSFLFALLLSFISMNLFLKSFFKPHPSLFGAFLYASSPYVAVEIFARGNIGEVWFLALLPLALYLIYKNAQLSSPYIFTVTALVTSFTLTVHNVLSLLFLPLVIMYILALQKPKRNFFALFCGVMLAGYFLIPALVESNLTNASKIAEITQYQDHFLCWWQIWTTNAWGYGASNPGCLKDGISFMVGKVQIVTGIVGLLVLLYHLSKRSKLKFSALFTVFAITLIVSTFLTTYSSSTIWEVLKFMTVFQFPWRFLIFTVFGLAFFSAYLFTTIKPKFLQILIPLFLSFIIIFQSKYFYKPPMTKIQFNKLYLSESGLREHIAYRVAEYLPKTGDYTFWKSIEFSPAMSAAVVEQTKKFIYVLDKGSYRTIKSDSFYKEALVNSSEFVINVHYLPFWRIKINNIEYIPNQFDQLARPVVKLNGTDSKTVDLYFEQTPIEKAANLVTVIGMIVTVAYSFIIKKNHSHKD